MMVGSSHGKESDPYFLVLLVLVSFLGYVIWREVKRFKKAKDGKQELRKVDAALAKAKENLKKIENYKPIAGETVP